MTDILSPNTSYILHQDSLVNKNISSIGVEGETRGKMEQDGGLLTGHRMLRFHKPEKTSGLWKE
jgi:hypothetical protein